MIIIIVVKEPIVCDGFGSADNLIADLCVRGVWEPQSHRLRHYLTSE